MIEKPKTHAAKPIGYQLDFADGPDVPAYADTAIGRELRHFRLIHKLSATACGRACGGLSAKEWREIEDGKLVVEAPVEPLCAALQEEADLH